MTYLELVTSIRLKIDDENSTRFSTNESIRIVINEAYKHLYRELVRQKIYTDVQHTTITFTSGNQEIAFASGEFDNIQKIVLVHDSENMPIPLLREEVSLRGDGRSVYIKRTMVQDGGDPDKKTEKVFLGWHTDPSSTFIVSVHYKPKIQEFSSSVLDTSQLDLIPVEHHDVVVLRAVVLLLGIDEANANFWYTLYREALQSMIESISLENEVDDQVVDVMSERRIAQPWP